MTDARTEVRRDLAELFRTAATSRREYLDACPDERHRELLELECTTLDSVADVIGGDPSALYSWLPSWRWTPEMLAALRGPVEPVVPEESAG